MRGLTVDAGAGAGAGAGAVLALALILILILTGSAGSSLAGWSGGWLDSLTEALALALGFGVDNMSVVTFENHFFHISWYSFSRISRPILVRV